MIYCISFEPGYRPLVLGVLTPSLILYHSHTPSMNMDILYGVRISKVLDSGYEHFNAMLVF